MLTVPCRCVHSLTLDANAFTSTVHTDRDAQREEGGHGRRGHVNELKHEDTRVIEPSRGREAEIHTTEKGGGAV